MQPVQRNRVSKTAGGSYTGHLNVVQRRVRDLDLALYPEQGIEYVVDDERSSRDRIALAHEDIESYDSSYYETRVVRVLRAFFRRSGEPDIRRKLSQTRELDLTMFGTVTDE